MIYLTRLSYEVDPSLGHNNAGSYLTDGRFMLFMMYDPTMSPLYQTAAPYPSSSGVLWSTPATSTAGPSKPETPYHTTPVDRLTHPCRLAVE